MAYKPVGADEDGHFPPRVEAALSATFVPKWKPTTAYLAGDKVLNPTGDVVSAIANFTSGASFNAANWNYSPTFARAASAQFAPGRRWVFLGDSITAGSNASPLYAYADVAIRMAGTSRVRDMLDGSYNAGVPGDTTTGALARFDTDVTAHNPQGLHIQLGTNDVGQNVPLVTFSSNIVAIVAKGKALGIPVTIGTVPPRGTTDDTKRKLTDAYNLWLRLWAPGAGVTLADTFNAIASPTTGDTLAAYDSDGVHPTTAGHRMMGVKVADAIRQATPPQPAWFASAPTKGNLISNPIMNGAGPLPTSWLDATWFGSGGTAPTFTVVADTSGTLTAGKWLQMAWNAAANSNRSVASNNFPGGPYTAGTTLIVCARVQVEDVAGWDAARVAGSANASITILDPDTAVAIGTAMVNIDAVGMGSIVKVVTIPAGHTNLALAFKANIPTGVQANFRLGQVAVYDITALGVSAGV
jgi:lysophospholipase L1-like esterase